MIEHSKWKWFGNAGHLCVSERCRFHIATEIGETLVSTVGEYCPKGLLTPDKTECETLGLSIPPTQLFYETMVFKVAGHCACGCGLPETAGNELDSQRYETAAEANEGHFEMCEKWAKEAA